MPRDRIVFWQEAPFGDQAPYQRAIAVRMAPSPVVVAVHRSATTNFKHGVWGKLEFAPAEVVVVSDPSTMRAILDTVPERSAHVFGSFVRSTAIRDALEMACRSKALVGLLSEARDWRGWKGLARRCHSILHERCYRDRVDFVLAIGALGQEWFEKNCAYPREKVFPWCYVCETPPADVGGDPPTRGQSDDEIGSTVRIVFVGALIDRKAVDILLKALAAIASENWCLSVLGGGERADALKALAQHAGIATRVQFPGIVPNTEVRRHLRSADLLVLPSHWDGWGAVVNEALMAGVPVVCSDWCGAKVLIRPGWNGDVVRAGSVADLARTIEAWIDRGPLSAARRAEIRAWSRCIDGDTVARYLLQIIAYVSGESEQRPIPPWGGGMTSGRRPRAFRMSALIACTRAQAGFEDLVQRQHELAYAGNPDLAHVHDGHVVYLDAVFVRRRR